MSISGGWRVAALAAAVGRVLCASMAAAQSHEVTVPAIGAVTVDGRVDADEWRGARWVGSDGVDLGFGAGGGVLYVAARTAPLFVASLCVEVGDTVRVLHASSAVGEVRYVRDGADWRLLDSFEWRLRGLDAGPDASRARRGHLERYGWVANTVEVGEAGETEFLISSDRIPWSRARVALGVMESADGAPLGGWPLGPEADGCTLRATIAGPPPPRATFLTDRWLRLRLTGDDVTRSTARPGMPTVERVVIPSGSWRLVGDLVLPGQTAPRPAVLMLNQAGGDRAPYRGLALALAERGIASLRVDLRGHGESTNLGRFVPGEVRRDPLIWDAEADVAASLAFLHGQASVAPGRVGVVAASYSGEEAAEAGRLGRYVALYALLSPGSLSDESIDAIGPSSVPWLLVTAEDDRFLVGITAALRERAPDTELWTLPGTGHGTDLLEEHDGLAERMADWIEGRLR